MKAILNNRIVTWALVAAMVMLNRQRLRPTLYFTSRCSFENKFCKYCCLMSFSWFFLKIKYFGKFPIIKSMLGNESKYSCPHVTRVSEVEPRKLIKTTQAKDAGWTVIEFIRKNGLSELCCRFEAEKLASIFSSIAPWYPHKDPIAPKCTKQFQFTLSFSRLRSAMWQYFPRMEKRWNVNNPHCSVAWGPNKKKYRDRR